jgi:hypothetical protein
MRSPPSAMRRNACMSAVIGSGVLAAAIGMVGQARGRLLPLDMVRAAMISSARMWSRIAQPTILRVKRSSRGEPAAAGRRKICNCHPEKRREGIETISSAYRCFPRA